MGLAGSTLTRRSLFSRFVKQVLSAGTTGAWTVGAF